MKRLLIPFLLVAAALALPAGARASGPTLGYAHTSGYQIAIGGAGWNPAATVTFSLLKGAIAQSIDLRPASDGTFEVGLNNVNICGLTSYAAKDTAGESVVLHGAGVMCMQNYTPPPPGTAALVVLHGQSAAPQPGPSLAPRPLLTHYFADLNTHRYAQALALESDCALSFMPQPQSGQMIRLATAAPYRPSALSFIRAARITGIQRLDLQTLTAATLDGFRVSGSFQLAGSPAAHHGLRSGSHHFTVIVRQCGGRWTVDPGWLSPSSYSWL